MTLLRRVLAMTPCCQVLWEKWKQSLIIKPGPLAQVASALTTELWSLGNHNPPYLLHSWYSQIFSNCWLFNLLIVARLISRPRPAFRLLQYASVVCMWEECVDEASYLPHNITTFYFQLKNVVMFYICYVELSCSSLSMSGCVCSSEPGVGGGSGPETQTDGRVQV